MNVVKHDYLFKLLLSICFLVLVRMELERHLPVRLLDLLLVSVLIHSKNFVVVLPLRLLQFQFGLL